MSRQFGVSVVLWYSAQVVSGVFSDSQCSKIHTTVVPSYACMCSNPRAPATQELQELSIGIPYCFACIPSRLVLSDHMQNSELY